MQHLLQDSPIWGSDVSDSNYKPKEAMSKAVIFNNKNHDEAIVRSNMSK